LTLVSGQPHEFGQLIAVEQFQWEFDPRAIAAQDLQSPIGLSRGAMKNKTNSYWGGTTVLEDLTGFKRMIKPSRLIRSK
jgi:hypothetical protein